MEKKLTEQIEKEIKTAEGWLKKLTPKHSKLLAGIAMLGLGAASAVNGEIAPKISDTTTPYLERAVGNCQNYANDYARGRGVDRALDAQNLFERCMTEVIETETSLAKIGGFIDQDGQGTITHAEVPLFEKTNGAPRGDTKTQFETASANFGTAAKGGVTKFILSKDCDCVAVPVTKTVSISGTTYVQFSSTEIHEIQTQMTRQRAMLDGGKSLGSAKTDMFTRMDEGLGK